MNSSLIGKIEKAQRYAQEPERITLKNFEVTFRGDNNDHTIAYCDGEWECTCNFFAHWGMCSHTFTLQKIFEAMLPATGKEQPYIEELATPEPELATAAG